MQNFEKIINQAWDNKEQISSKSEKSIIEAINQTIELTDQGKIRVAEKRGGEWIVNQWIKKAMLLSFRINEMETTKGPYATWFDKVKGKTADWDKEKFTKAYTKEDVYITISKKDLRGFEVFLEYTGPIVAPIKKDEEVAIIKIYNKDELIKSVPLFAFNEVKKINFLLSILTSFNHMIWGDV